MKLKLEMRLVRNDVFIMRLVVARNLESSARA